MSYKNDDLRIKNIEQLLPPIALLERFPASDFAAETVEKRAKRFIKLFMVQMIVY